MRVLESSLPPYAMGKKQRLRKSRDSKAYNIDSSDDGKICRHINKSLNLGSMRKTLKQLVFGECTTCSKEAAVSNRSVTDSDSVSESESTVCVCLQCGHQGCDRSSKYQHALKHHETPRSVSHAITVNTTTWLIWCYDCDDEVDLQGSKKLQESVELVKKFAGADKKPETQIQETDSGMAKQDKEDGIEGYKTQEENKRNKTISSYPKVVGFCNLGNTCFFNAVLQGMSQTHELVSLLTEKSKMGIQIKLVGSKDVVDISASSDSDSEGSNNVHGKPLFVEPLTVTLAETGSLSQQMVKFFDELFADVKRNSISPTQLFASICKKAPRFRGYQQQDAHELLRHLLDAIKMEEVQRTQKGILKELSINPKKVDEDSKLKLKEYGKQAKHTTFIDSLFGGHLISTVLCEECKLPSQKLENFLDLSLPVLEDKGSHVRPNSALSGAKKQADKVAGHVTSAMEGFAHNTSKYLAKKAKKAKKAQKKHRKWKTSVSEVSSKIDEKEEVSKETEEDKAADNPDIGSNDEEMSDADVEDNAESDLSRRKEPDTMSTDNGGYVSDKETPNEPLKANTKEKNLSIEETPRKTEDVNCIEDLNVQVNQLNLEDSKGEIILANQNVKCNDKTESHHQENDKDIIERNNSLDNKNTENSLSDENKNTERENVKNSTTKVKGNCEKVKPKSEINREEMMKAMMTLGNRYQPEEHECSVMSCLHQFTSAELLTGHNKFGCTFCTKSRKIKDGKNDTVYTNASKQLLIFNPPAIMTLHLKRFQQVGYTLRKVNRHVSFPMVLDISPFCSSMAQNMKPNEAKLLYSLYGLVEHSGRLNAGHYTAFVKVRQNTGLCKQFLQNNGINPKAFIHHLQHEEDNSDLSEKEAVTPEGRWYHVSDVNVRECSESSVLKAQAYILFYERIL